MCVVQMIFLEIYFCVFTMFLNNVSTSTVKDKTRSAQNLAVHILACGCLLTSPGLRVPELCTDHAFLGVLCELAGWGQAGPRPAPPLPLFHLQRGSLSGLVEARLLSLSHLFNRYLVNTFLFRGLGWTVWWLTW